MKLAAGVAPREPQRYVVPGHGTMTFDFPALFRQAAEYAALVQALGTLGPEIARAIDERWHNPVDGYPCACQDCQVVALLRQVQALIPKGE